MHENLFFYRRFKFIYKFPEAYRRKLKTSNIRNYNVQFRFNPLRFLSKLTPKIIPNLSGSDIYYAYNPVNLRNLSIHN
jgi:hypothetical protein